MQGLIEGFIGGATPNKVDYYGFGVLAGQTVNVSVTVALPSSQIGIFDSDGRLVYSATTNASGVASVSFTADRPGAYRLAVGLPGDFAVNGNPSLLTNYSYIATITGLTNEAIGGIRSHGDIDMEDPDSPPPTAI